MVTLTVCTRDDGIAQGTVSKRQGERYRSARDVAWGDAWAGSD
jgi:ribosomal protein RSM22 (predicted rRNA methylase)